MIEIPGQMREMRKKLKNGEFMEKSASGLREPSSDLAVTVKKETDGEPSRIGLIMVQGIFKGGRVLNE